MENNYSNHDENPAQARQIVSGSERSQIPQYIPKPLSPDKLYRREVKRALMKIILALVAYFVIEIVFMAIMQSVIMLTSGIMDNMVSMAQHGEMELDMSAIMAEMQDNAAQTVVQYTGILTLISAVIGLPIFLFIRGGKMFTSDIAERRAPMSVSIFVKLFIIAMGAQIVFDIGTALANMALADAGKSTTAMLEQSMEMLNTPVGLLYICLVGPVIEELIFRGAIMKSLERFGINFAIIISSLAFGLFHIFTVQAIFASCMGLILGYIASRYSLKWSILTHILINSTATGLSYLNVVTFGDSADNPGAGALSLSTVIMLAFFMVGVIFLVLERWRFAEQKSVGAPVRIEGSPEAVGSALWKAAFTSIPLLLYIAFTLFAGIAMIAWGMNLISLGN